MAKDKIKELEYKIEGLRRMLKRKIKRGKKNRKRSLNKLRNWQHDISCSCDYCSY